MWYLIRKYLSPFTLLILASCVPRTPEIISTDHSSISALTAYPLSTSYPEPVQPWRTVSSSDTLQNGTSLPSPSPSVLPPPTELISTSLQITKLQMVDTTTGWAINSDPSIRPWRDQEKSKILRTTQGIQTWIDVTPPISKNSSIIRAAFFVDANTAVVASNRSSPLKSPIVDVVPWRTRDGGQTWQTGETLRIEQASELSPSHLFFIDPQHGWMLGESDAGMQNMRVHFFETRDGGFHWEMMYDTVDHLSDPDTLWIKGYFPFPEHFTFTSETTGFFSDGRLFNTQDGGRSWIFRPLDPPADIPDIDCQGGDCKYLDTISAPQFSSIQDGVLIRRAYLNSEVVMDVFVYYPNTLNRLPLPTAQYFYFTHDSGQTSGPEAFACKDWHGIFHERANGLAIG